jgi:transcriptional/translational regulatory protein YebC/TACO1
MSRKKNGYLKLSEYTEDSDDLEKTLLEMDDDMADIDKEMINQGIIVQETKESVKKVLAQLSIVKVFSIITGSILLLFLIYFFALAG